MTLHGLLREMFEVIAKMKHISISYWNIYTKMLKLSLMKKKQLKQQQNSMMRMMSRKNELHNG